MWSRETACFCCLCASWVKNQTFWNKTAPYVQTTSTWHFQIREEMGDFWSLLVTHSFFTKTYFLKPPIIFFSLFVAKWGLESSNSHFIWSGQNCGHFKKKCGSTEDSGTNKDEGKKCMKIWKNMQGFPHLVSWLNYVFILSLAWILMSSCFGGKKFD